MKGFTLIEVVIVVVIIGVLGMMAYPQYGKYILQSRRTEAFTRLLNWQARYESFLIENSTYPESNTFAPTSDNYEYTSNVSGSSYVLTARAIGGQKDDKEGSTSCELLSLSNQGVGAPSVCWD